MEQNEYNAAEAVEIGKAKDVILGVKILVPDIDSTSNGAPDRHYQE